MIPRSYIYLLLIVIWSFSNFQILFAQQPDTVKIELQEIEVKATHSSIDTDKAPFSIKVLRRTNAELNRTPAITLDEITYRLPGIWVSDRENFALGERITVRGFGWRATFGVRGSQIILDGIPLTVADGQSVLNVIDPMFLERMELIRGPASAFWGNSSGGVLYLSSVSAPPSTTQFKGRTTVGAFGLRKVDSRFSRSTGKHSVNMFGSYLYREGYREHSKTKVGRLGITGNIDIGENDRLSYFGAYVNMPKAEHPSSITREQAEQDPTQANASFLNTNAGKEVQQGQLGISYLKNISAGLLTATGYGIFRDLNNPLPFAIIDLDRLAGGGRVTFQTQFSNLGLSIGTESDFQRDDRVEFDNDNGSRGTVEVDQLEKVFNNAWFVTGEYNLGQITFAGGIRFDWLRFTSDASSAEFSGKRTFTAFNPSFGINYALDNIEFYSNVSSGFESPTTTELVNRPDGGNGFNPDLSQENSIGIETGSRGTIRSLNLEYDLAVYHYWVNELIFPFQLEADGPIFFRNQGETRHWGGEISLTYNPALPVRSGINYNMTQALFTEAVTLDNESLDEKRIPGIPKNRISGFMEWQPGPLWINVNLQYVDRYPVNNENTAYNDSYFVMDSRLSHRGIDIGGETTLVPFLELNNLFDTQYNGSVVINAFGGRYYEPASDLGWRAGFTLQFQTRN